MALPGARRPRRDRRADGDPADARGHPRLLPDRRGYRRARLDEARDAVDFELVVPSPPSTTYFDDPIVNMTWDSFVLSQWRGEQLPLVQKQAGPNSQVTQLG